MSSEARAAIVDYVRRELIGPVGPPDELIPDAPERRYTLGALFPREASQDAILREDMDDEVVGATRDDPMDDPIALANQWMPSSVGFSVFLDGADGVLCRLSASRYERVSERAHRGWRRVAISSEGEPEMVELSWADGNLAPQASVFGGLASVRAQVRPLGGGHLVTVTLVNDQSHEGATGTDSARCLFQVGLACSPASGVIREYPRSEALIRDEEEAELRLMYRKVRTFAVGHGCAAVWDSSSAEPSAVRVEFMPIHEIPPLEPVKADTAILELGRLADPEMDPAVMHAELIEFVRAYEEWIGREETDARETSDGLRQAADRVVSRLRHAAERMTAGADLLRSDPLVRRAFQLANRSMVMQMDHSKVIAAERRTLGSAAAVANQAVTGARRWFPFQLAFILMTLPSLADSRHQDRDLVDLIWFPTGGGKTEAYLALAATEIFLRRLRSGDQGAGTTVITRYTLRLLTSQQFQRAASLTCACEIIRRELAAEMGIVPVSIGLWVGGGATPNNYIDARDRFDAVRDGNVDDSFLQVDRCPWCGVALIPDDRRDLSAYGAEATATSFRMFCPSSTCEFHDGLPISVVDDQMYQSPPTILLGTVDKFAQLAWSDRGGAFFGLDRFAPPSLIIQDELHLISGPLGTTVGMYEAAIEGLLRLANAKPKIVASTATIRRSGDQVLGVFGRSVNLFPPSGINASNSYFARENRDSPGRMFVGVMSQSHTPSTSLIHLAAAVAQAPVELDLSGDALDAYWTQVIYHNSLRELGKSVTYARDDIPARIGVIAADEARRRDLGDGVIVELTSNVPSGMIPGILSQLFTPVSRPDAISMLLATNMIQVGIDVPRLGLMVVNGQPKSTSEYIQASSRVGRGSAPGLVITMYSASKPRDRSHYENFLPYHAALYRHVEPTSVTPFALPSRQRALHAALVILCRHGLGLAKNDAAGDFSPAIARQAKANLLDWVATVDSAESDATAAHLDRLIDVWTQAADDARAAGVKLHYRSGRQHHRLLKHFYELGAGWPTLDSMRSVDRECSVDVEGAAPHA